MKFSRFVLCSYRRNAIPPFNLQNGVLVPGTSTIEHASNKSKPICFYLGTVDESGEYAEVYLKKVNDETADQFVAAYNAILSN
jgi:hypothetical protein